MEIVPKTCPLCGKKYTKNPALSRVDNITFICPECGVRQALESIGIKKDEQEEILKILHKHNKI